MLPAAHRLRRSGDFATTVRRGRRVARGCVVVHLLRPALASTATSASASTSVPISASAPGFSPAPGSVSPVGSRPLDDSDVGPVLDASRAPVSGPSSGSGAVGVSGLAVASDVGPVLDASRAPESGPASGGPSWGSGADGASGPAGISGATAASGLAGVSGVGPGLVAEPASAGEAGSAFPTAQVGAASSAGVGVTLDTSHVPADSSDQVNLHDGGDPGVAEPARAGFVVSKAVGGAVVRNRVKRRLRHLMAERIDRLPPGATIVVRAQPGAALRQYQEMALDLENALDAALRSGRRQ